MSHTLPSVKSFKNHMLHPHVYIRGLPNSVISAHARVNDLRDDSHVSSQGCIAINCRQLYHGHWTGQLRCGLRRTSSGERIQDYFDNVHTCPYDDGPDTR